MASKARRRSGSEILMVFMVGGLLSAAAYGVYALMNDTAPAPVIAGNPSLGEAQACLQEGNFSCAEADYYAYLQRYPNDSTANAQLAIALTQDGRHKEALPFYKHAGQLGVATYDYYAGYATSLDKTGRTDEAIKMNYAALKLVPQLVDVRGALADELARKGRKDEALNLLESFDQSLVDQGHAPYFTSQIARLKGATADQSETAALLQAPPKPGTTEVALLSESGILHVPVLVNDSLALNFVVDSGASDVTIPEDVAKTLMQNGTLTGADFRALRIYIMADGTRMPSQMFMLRSLKVGDREVRDVTASITKPGGPLLLGQSFLRKFKSWSIDNRRKVLVLQD